MATILAAANGNWSATSTWIGGVVPVAGDIVVANNRTVTMDTLNITVAELRNDTAGGAAAGGTFNLVNGSNVTANVYGGSTGSCVTWASTAGQTATITGQFFGGAGGNGINCTGAGNLTCGGGSQTTGGTSGTASGLVFGSSGTLNFATAGSPGVITGGTSTNALANGISCSGSSSTINIYASTIRGASSGAGYAIIFSGASQNVTVISDSIGDSNQNAIAILFAGASASHAYTVSGNVQGGSGSNAHGINATTGTGTYTLTVAGNIIGGTGSSATGIVNGSTTATINIVANIVNTASPSNNNFSVNNTTTGTVNLSGVATAGATQVTCANTSTGILRVTRAKGNGFGVGSVGISGVVAVQSASQSSLTYIEEIEFGSLGATPVSGPIGFIDVVSNKCIVTTTTGGTKTLVDTAATAGVLPATSDVRSGVVYSSGNLTGTCAVPAAGSVALSVPVDNTTGTAVLTADAVRSAVGLASANLDAQLDALPTAAEIWSAETRTITGGTVDTLTNSPDVPTEAEIAEAVRTELATELGRVDANISSRLAPDGTLARVTLADTVTDLTNAPDVPTESEIADAVRTELAPELARISNTATVQNVADIVEGAFDLPEI